MPAQPFHSKFLTDLDSEGFVTHALSTLNIGSAPDVQISQALLADHKCIPCNPPGWDVVDGVTLPPITWGHGV